MPSPLPLYVYKLLPEAPPNPLPDALPLSALDARDGFIHLSTANETPKIAAWFYSPMKSLWVLKIPLAKIESDVKWWEANSNSAHLYGRDLGRGEVLELKEYTKQKRKIGQVCLGSMIG